MESKLNINQTKKKRFKKLVIALFAVTMFLSLDLTAYAAEDDGSTHIVTTRIIQHYYEDDGSTYIDGYPRETVIATLTSDSPIYAFLCQDIYGMNTQSVTLWSYIISASPLCVNGEAVNQYTFEKDGQTYYICTGGYFSTGGDSPHYLEQFADGADYVYQCGSAYSADSYGRNALISDFQNSSIQGDIQIDYDSFEIDNDMPVINDLKRNVIENKVTNGLTTELFASEVYDYVTWTNTSKQYYLQLETMPVVQYYKVTLTKNIFLKEFQGEWATQEIYSDVTNSYIKHTDVTNLPLEDPEAWNFYCDCTNNYSCGFLEDNYLFFGYRLRYVDIENKKAGPWVVLMPSQEKNFYVGYIEYSDDSTIDLDDVDGVVNEYTDLENIEDAMDDVDTENRFKDEYEIVDNEVDVQEATNWLNTVINFIKGTPSVISVVLVFLPKPILYGLYVVLFLGVIGAGFGIIRALI